MAFKILKVLKYHAYHINLTQDLKQHHVEMRIDFCQWALQRIQDDPDLFKRVHFADEAKHYSEEHLNRYNCHYWSNENSHWHRTVDHQNRCCLIVDRHNYLRVT